MSLRLRIALRYLVAPKSHTVVNVISGVAIAGMALATAALVVVMSVFNGFHSLIAARLSVLDAPLTATATEGKTLATPDSLIAALEADAAIDLARPSVQERALAEFDGRQMTVRLRAVAPELYDRFDGIAVAGSPWEEYHPGAESGVLSVGVANRLEVPVGSEALVRLYAPRRKGRINPANPMTAFRTDSIAPSGVYVLNQQEFDTDLIYVPLATARRLLQLADDQSTALDIYPAPGRTEAARKAAQALLGPDVRVQTLAERQSGSFQIVNMEKWLTFMLLGFIMLIASFNIVSSLSLLIIEKEPNAATLRALGETPAGIRNIYRIEGLLITGFGAVIGLIGGTLLSLGQERFGWVKLAGDSSTLSVTSYPVDFQPLDLIPVALLALGIGLLASLAATRKS